MSAEPPLASVVIPLYRSGNTLAACLDALQAQTERRFETILIDSSDDDRSRSIAAHYPGVEYLRPGRRLWPQAARNYGAERARGRLLVFTDPDIYPDPGWLAALIRSYESAPGVVFGPIACHGRRWVDRGVHLCKFNICLPGGDPRPVPLGWSGNVLIPRDVFEALGGWETQRIQGDSVFSARARESGVELRFEPGAMVFHDHEGVSLAGLFRERFARGREFAQIEAAGELGEGGRGAASRKTAMMPLRAAGAMRRIWRAASAAGMRKEYLATLPILLLGVAGWYSGLAAGWRSSAQRSRRS